MRIARLWVLTLGAGFVIVLAAPAANAGCPLLGCLTETVEDVTGVVGEVVEEATGVVEETVEDVPELVDHTGKEVEEVPKLVNDTVDDVTNSEDPPVPVPDTDPADEPAGREQRSGPAESRQAPTGTGIPSPAPVSPLSEPTVDRAGPRVVRSNEPGLLRRIGEAAAVAARQLTFPLGLSVIVVAFLLFQNYLDRKDPKLAVAPIAADVLPFE